MVERKPFPWRQTAAFEARVIRSFRQQLQAVIGQLVSFCHEAANHTRNPRDCSQDDHVGVKLCPPDARYKRRPAASLTQERWLQLAC